MLLAFPTPSSKSRHIAFFITLRHIFSIQTKLEFKVMFPEWFLSRSPKTTFLHFWSISVIKKEAKSVIDGTMTKVRQIYIFWLGYPSNFLLFLFQHARIERNGENQSTRRTLSCALTGNIKRLREWKRRTSPTTMSGAKKSPLCANMLDLGKQPLSQLLPKTTEFSTIQIEKERSPEKSI